jgi:hypothetical protein
MRSRAGEITAYPAKHLSVVTITASATQAVALHPLGWPARRIPSQRRTHQRGQHAVSGQCGHAPQPAAMPPPSAWSAFRIRSAWLACGIRSAWPSRHWPTGLARWLPASPWRHGLPHHFRLNSCYLSGHESALQWVAGRRGYDPSRWRWWASDAASAAGLPGPANGRQPKQTAAHI